MGCVGKGELGKMGKKLRCEAVSSSAAALAASGRNGVELLRRWRGRWRCMFRLGDQAGGMPGKQPGCFPEGSCGDACQPFLPSPL